MKLKKTIEVRVERTISAPQVEVFDAWLNPKIPGTPWSEADKFGMTAREEEEGESLDYKLSAEEPDVTPEPGPPAERPARVHRGQIDGTPEDGDSLFNVDR